MTMNANVRVRGRSRAEIQRMAEAFRMMIGETGGSINSPFPIVRVIEELATPRYLGDTPFLNFQVCEDGDPKLVGAYAFYDPDSRTMYIRESVYNGAEIENPRDRFTLAHELGHCLLGHGNNCTFARTNDPVPAYANPEWQADTFASMLLIPRSAIFGMSIREVADTYHVSYQAAKIAVESKKANSHWRAN